MRVTDRLIYERSSRELGRARTDLDVARQAVSTGRRVNHPGDDPGTAGSIAAFVISRQRAEALGRTAKAAAEELTGADGALATVSNALARAQELAVQFSNDTYTAAQRTAGALEVDAVIGTIVAALNTKYGNRYVFGGFKDDAPPFDVAGNYAGDSGVRQVEIAPGVLQATSLRAEVAFRGDGGGVNVLAMLGSLRGALQSNDVAGVRSSLTDLDRSVTQVSTARAEVGVAMATLDAASEAARLAALDEESTLVRLSETDLATGAIQLAQAQNALEASMAATAQSIKVTLLDYLR